MNNLAHLDGCSTKICKTEGGVEHAMGGLKQACTAGGAVACKISQARLDWWYLKGILLFPCLPFKKKTIWAVIQIESWTLMIDKKYLYGGVHNYRKQTFHLLLQCFLHFTEQVICAASGMSRWNMTEGWSPIYLNVPLKSGTTLKILDTSNAEYFHAVYSLNCNRQVQC